MSVRAIAEKAQVSITTVSRVLNNRADVSQGARQRVLSAISDVGYRHSVGRKSINNVAFVYTGEFWLGSQFDSAVMSGMSRGLQEAGFDLMILEAGRARQPNESYAQMFLRKGVRGAILRTTEQSRSVCEAIVAEGFPCVVVADRFDNPLVNYVYSDSLESSQNAVEHLIGLGHKRIAIALNVVDDSDHNDRYEGYRKALTDHGLEIDPKLTIRVQASREGGTTVIRRLMALSERPTAVFITDPLTAVGALYESRNHGVCVPRELSVVGFDDTDVRYEVFPRLTAVCQDAPALGREAISILNSVLDTAEVGGNRVAVRKSLRTWLDVGASTSTPGMD